MKSDLTDKMKRSFFQAAVTSILLYGCRYIETVLFQTIQFNISTQFNCQKLFYFKLFSLVKQF